MEIKDLKFLKVKIEKHPTRGTNLEYLQKQDAVAILILNFSKEEILLVNQYRPGVRGKLLEIPAGIIEHGEKPIETVYREVREETGYEKKNYEFLYIPKKSLILSPGYTTESLYIYIVKLKEKNIIPKELILDVGEDIEVRWVKIDDVKEYTNDFKTYYAIELYKNLK